MKYVSDRKELESKQFDTIADLEAAEKKLDEEQAEKTKASLERKEDAKKVEEAFKALNAEKKAHNEAILNARKAYNVAVLKADKEYDASLAEIDKKLAAKETAYQEALAEFTEKHPEGYHMTLKDGDAITTIDKNTNSKDFNKAAAAMEALLDTLFKPFIW